MFHVLSSLYKDQRMQKAMPSSSSIVATTPCTSSSTRKQKSFDNVVLNETIKCLEAIRQSTRHLTTSFQLTSLSSTYPNHTNADEEGSSHGSTEEMETTTSDEPTKVQKEQIMMERNIQVLIGDVLIEYADLCPTIPTAYNILLQRHFMPSTSNSYSTKDKIESRKEETSDDEWLYIDGIALLNIFHHHSIY